MLELSQTDYKPAINKSVLLQHDPGHIPFIFWGITHLGERHPSRKTRLVYVSADSNCDDSQPRIYDNELLYSQGTR